MKVSLIEYPSEQDWIAVKKRALVTIGKEVKLSPVYDWKVKILEAGHSPIRRLQFSFFIEDVPYYVSTHLVRHIHAQPYVKSQRNDRQSDYDRTKAPQDSPVNMIWDMNAEELITICHKRLCMQASKETRQVVQEMVKLVLDKLPEFNSVLVPLCYYRNGKCTEFNPCGFNKNYKEN